MTFLNVTLQDLLGGVAQAADNNTSASDSSSGALVQQQPAAVGAVLVTGVRDVRMEGCTCQRVTGATGWGCLAVELAEEVRGCWVGGWVRGCVGAWVLGAGWVGGCVGAGCWVGGWVRGWVGAWVGAGCVGLSTCGAQS